MADGTGFGAPAAPGVSAAPLGAAGTPFAGGMPAPFGAGAFGKPTAAGAFGKPTPTGAFGKATTAGAFGKPMAPGAFGKPMAPGAFGKPMAPGAFGKPMAPGAFGKPTGPGAFGKPTAPDAFGKPMAPGAFGKAAPLAPFAATAPIAPTAPGAPLGPGVGAAPTCTTVFGPVANLCSAATFVTQAVPTTIVTPIPNTVAPQTSFGAPVTVDVRTTPAPLPAAAPVGPGLGGFSMGFTAASIPPGVYTSESAIVGV